MIRVRTSRRGFLVYAIQVFFGVIILKYVFINIGIYREILK